MIIYIIIHIASAIIFGFYIKTNFMESSIPGFVLGLIFSPLIWLILLIMWIINETTNKQD
jgi:tetrahydromethanopterin S-methyltransferase subunit B